jgi:hypothetical protein
MSSQAKGRSQCHLPSLYKLLIPDSALCFVTRALVTSSFLPLNDSQSELPSNNLPDSSVERTI